MRTLASWCYRHRRVVVPAWLALVVALVGLAQVAGTAYDNSLSLAGTESNRAYELLKANAPAQAGDTEQVVIAARASTTLADPAVRTQAEALFAKLATLPDVTGIVSPYAPQGAGQTSEDGTVAFATLHFAGSADTTTKATGSTLVDTARSFRSDQLDVAVGGQIAAKAGDEDLGGVGIGILAAALVLLLVFGSLLAAALPLVSTLLVLPAAGAGVGLLSHVVSIPDFSGQVMMLIGLGVGIDYALFIVTRMRQGLQAGMTVEDAIVTAVVTSGRAVLFAGAVVCIALLGMLALGVGILGGLGIAASVGVLFTMASAVTLLPALLGFFGTKVLSRSQRKHIAAGDGVDETGLWWRWSNVVSRRPILPAVIALVVVGALTVPVFSLRLGAADAGNGSPHKTTRQAYDLLATGFGPGFNGPLQVAAEAHSAADLAVVDRIRAAIAADPGVATVSPAHVLAANGDNSVLALEVYPASAPQDAATTELVERLRSTVIPGAALGSGVQAFVGGSTASAIDFGEVLTGKMPLFVGLVVLLSFLLLTLVFRSLLISLTAALMNVLSVAAALGVLTAVYVWGWGGDLLGAGRGGPIEAAMPVMTFAILFGLSMDYQVFLVSRIQEEWHRTGDNKLAVTRGLAITGRTITAAAVIMIVVFGSFILGGDRLIKEFGLGLAAAVFVDAFLIRVAIVPAVMFLLGKHNWWLPRRLDSVLPRMRTEMQIATPDDARELTAAGYGRE